MDMLVSCKRSCWSRVLFIIVIGLLLLKQQTCAVVNTDGCRPYQAVKNDSENYLDSKGRALLEMGETWNKRFHMSTSKLTGNFGQAALRFCTRYNLTLASIRTPCEYGIINSWFEGEAPTFYSAWIAGFRFGYIFGPIWLTTGEPLDLWEFGVPPGKIQGPYPPSGYNPIATPWINCLSVSGNCPVYSGGPTDKCNTAKYEGLKFSFLDCRIITVRVICEEQIFD